MPPTACDIPAPIRVRPQLLPVDQLAWEDFERLCLRLIELHTEPIHVGLYGRPGQAQSGIDIYARDRLVPGETPPLQKYVSLQARRIEAVTEAELGSSVEEFLEGRWAGVSREFIYATSASMRSTKLVDETKRLADRLAEQSIELTVWDQEKISSRLKDHPKIVDDFFGREWVKAFCGTAAVTELSTRLDAQQAIDLRRKLARIYAAAFGVADSGLLAFRLAEIRTVGLQDRFVTPDLVSTTPQAAALPQPLESPSDSSADDQNLQALMEEAYPRNAHAQDEGRWHLPGSARRQHPVESPQVLERGAADQWIGTEPLQMIVGDPGAGKSTLLRFLVLDLLSEQPKWRAVAERWGQRLPIWLPFHFFTQRVAGQTGAAASIGEALRAWLDQYNAGQIWPLVEAALNDERLLLVVDGLDEWVSEEAGRSAIAALETFAKSHSVPLVVSTRPYGLAHLTLAAGSWAYKRIAPLTPEQQRHLALHYFRAAADTEGQSSAPEAIEQLVDRFLSQIHDTSDLHIISGTPLFFVLLVGLHLSNVTSLPTERFAIYDRAVQLLVADHPARRRTAAAVTVSRQSLSDHQLRVVLARVAFDCQVRGDTSTFQEATLRKDFICALHDPDHLAMNAADAAATADQLLNITEGELGLLVRKGPKELGFLHRILQEQLAAEHISDRLTAGEVNELFERYVGDPRWREVLLATIWRIPRPSELKDLMGILRQCIDESPAGLHTRELLAEVTFGPYGLPATEIQECAPDIVNVIETHPYGPHRARLLDSVLAGLEGAATGDVARECLERWTLLVREPSSELVWEIAQLLPVDGLSETACKLLMMALRNPQSWIAYASAAAIASRCSDSGPGSADERDLLRSELLHVLSDPPSGLAQAAALIALALEWREDPLVVDILNEARGHTDENVRLIALSDALGVLRTTFGASNALAELPRDVQQLSDIEREWLIGHLRTRGLTEMHSGLLVAAVSEAVRDQQSVIEELVDSLKPYSGPHGPFDLLWPVALNVLADDDRVVDILCEQFRSEERPHLLVRMNTGNLQLLALAYPPESPHRGRVAAAIEDRLRKYKSTLGERVLFGLAAVDQGPLMKEALLEGLANSSFPHWAAEALASYFRADDDAQTALHSVLMGDPVRASTIAGVAPRVLATTDVVPRLLAILRGLAESTDSQRGRYDIVASAIIRACQEQGIVAGPETESIAAEALKLMPTTPNSSMLLGDPNYDLANLAAALYPSKASKAALAQLAQVEDRPLEPYLRVFRDEPEQLRPVLADASKTLRSLPAYLRARVCQSLAERAVAPDVVLDLTRRWADEVSDLNKSIASLAYHRALLRAREQGEIDDSEWQLALKHLGDQATAYGPDHEARRRGAWVGMCVLGDWSMLEGCVETIGEPFPVGVPLTHLFEEPDRVLLQQLASRWQELRSEFGETLLSRLSGMRERQMRREVWGALALVAAQDATLEQELESAVAENCDLLGLNGVLAWFVSRDGTSADSVADALVSHLQNSDGRHINPISGLFAEPERIGLQREELLGCLENSLRRVPLGSGDPDPALEALAVLSPEHPAVREAWQELSSLSGQPIHPPHVPTYFAVVYAAADSSKILKQIELNLNQLDETGGTYYDSVFTRHVSYRLQHDTTAADKVREAVLNPATPDTRAALLVSLLAEAVGLDKALLTEVERRISGPRNVRLAPVLPDRAASATLSVQTILTRVADATWDAGLT